MNTSGQVPGHVGSLDELLAVAHAMEQEAAARYRALSADVMRHGDTALAAEFAMLAGMEDRHADDVARRTHSVLGHPPDPARVRWDLPDDKQEANRPTVSTVYQALAIAVRNEERAFAFYTYVAAEAEQPDIRAMAEELARDELRHAALLRHHRRRAFHAERPAVVERPETVDALRSIARQWDAEAAEAHAVLASVLDASGEAEDAAIFRRLAAREAEAASGAKAVTVPPLPNAAAGLRLLEAAFDRYALIGERANDELVVAEAQRLAGEIVARLALAGGARRNTLLGV